MKINYGKIPANMQPFGALQKKFEEEFAKTEKFFKSESKINVQFKIENNMHIVVAELHNTDRVFRATGKSNDMYNSINICEKNIERQIISSKRGYRSSSKNRVNSIAENEMIALEKNQPKPVKTNDIYERYIPAEEKHILEQKFGKAPVEENTL